LLFHFKRFGCGIFKAAGRIQKISAPAYAGAGGSQRMANENRWNGEDIAGRLRAVISETMESLELDKLNEAVKNTIGSALDEAKNQMEHCREAMENARWRRQPVPGDGKAAFRKPLEIRVRWKGKVSGILFTVFGSMGTVIFGLTALALLAIMTTSFGTLAGWWGLGICGAITAGFGGMLMKGVSQNKRVGRLKQYVAELERRNRSYCAIEDLSISCAKRQKFVKKDLRKMLRLGMLPDARMDEKEEWLMLDAETYRQYELSRKSLERQEREARRQEEAKKEEEGRRKLKEEASKQDGENDVEKAVRQGEEYMAALGRLRESMAGEPVAEKLVRLDMVLESLFETLRKHPGQLSELEKFMEYYLPTTMKLVATYHEFSLVEFPGENIREAKKEIERTLDTINKAFEKLLDDMYKDTAFDVMTDASVLQSMLAREGMTEGDFVNRP